LFNVAVFTPIETMNELSATPVPVTPLLTSAAPKCPLVDVNTLLPGAVAWS
jgi:hypothetical protein